MYKSPRKIFKVIVWKSLNKKNVYVFDTSEKEYTNEIVIKKDIYNDDSIETVYQKSESILPKTTNFKYMLGQKPTQSFFQSKNQNGKVII